jgi:hypothetical protein
MKSIQTIFAAAILSFVITGCYKPGCTDPAALNYDSKAKQDDISCEYTASVTFWATLAERDDLITLGHDTLRFELEGKIIDSMATAGFASTSGGCNTSGTKTIARQFSGNQERTYKYRVRGEDFVTVYEGFVTLKVDDCVPVKLDM